MEYYWILAVFGAVAFVIFKRSGCFFKSLFTSALGGLSALCAVWAVGTFVPISLGVNLFSAVFCAMFSVPGVICLLLLKTFVLPH